MVTILVLASIALVLACGALMAARANDQDQLVEPRPEPLTMGVQIICGDCAGDGYRPKRTYLDRSGRCARCGGRSYVLAAAVAPRRLAAMYEPSGEASGLSSRGRVIPFEPPPARPARPERIAV